MPQLTFIIAPKMPSAQNFPYKTKKKLYGVTVASVKFKQDLLPLITSVEYAFWNFSTNEA